MQPTILQCLSRDQHSTKTHRHTDTVVVVVVVVALVVVVVEKQPMQPTTLQCLSRDQHSTKTAEIHCCCCCNHNSSNRDTAHEAESFCTFSHKRGGVEDWSKMIWTEICTFTIDNDIIYSTAGVANSSGYLCINVTWRNSLHSATVLFNAQVNRVPACLVGVKAH